MSNKHDLITTIMLHATILQNKGVIDQLKSGLSSLGILNAIIEHPHLLESYFVAGKNDPLTAGMYVCVVIYVIVITQARVLCLIYTHNA